MHVLEFMNYNRLQQDHPCVINYIRRHYLKGPPLSGVPLNLDYPEVRDPSDGQPNTILDLLRNQVGHTNCITYYCALLRYRCFISESSYMYASASCLISYTVIYNQLNVFFFIDWIRQMVFSSNVVHWMGKIFRTLYTWSVFSTGQESLSRLIRIRLRTFSPGKEKHGLYQCASV